MKKLSLLLCVLMLSGCSWMKFWEDDEEDKIAPAELVDFNAEIRIHKLWTRGVGSGFDPVHASLKPALGADGTLYAADGKGRVYAVNASTGKIAWERDLEKSLSGGVGAGGGLVLVGDLEGRVFALDAATGALRWRKKLGSEILSAPASNSDVVVVQTLDAKLLGLSTETGDTLWQYSTDIPNLTLRGNCSPTITESMVITGFANGKIIALNAATGSLLWENRIAVPQGRTELERMVDIEGSPLLVGDVVYATSFQGRAAAMSRGTGRGLWYQDLSSFKDPAFGLEQVFVTQTDDQLKALRATSGQVLWSNDQMTYRQLTAPAYVDGYLAVADADGYLHVLSPVDGRFVGRTKVDGSGVSAPMLTDGKVLYVLDNDGDINAYRFESR